MNVEKPIISIVENVGIVQTYFFKFKTPQSVMPSNRHFGYLFHSKKMLGTIDADGADFSNPSFPGDRLYARRYSIAKTKYLHLKISKSR
jgi:hypothetical protein